MNKIGSYIHFFNWMTFKIFDRLLKTFVDFCKVYKFMDDFHILLFQMTFVEFVNL